MPRCLWTAQARKRDFPAITPPERQRSRRRRRVPPRVDEVLDVALRPVHGAVDLADNANPAASMAARAPAIAACGPRRGSPRALGDGLAPGLELRLHQRDELAARRRAARAMAPMSLPMPMNEASTTTRSGGGAKSSRREIARVDALAHVDARVVAELVGELAVADVDRDDARGAALEQAVGEAAGGRADVEAALALRRDAERVERDAVELVAAARDEARARGDGERRVARRASAPGLSTRRSPLVTSPAMISACACAREAARPRATSERVGADARRRALMARRGADRIASPCSARATAMQALADARARAAAPSARAAARTRPSRIARSAFQPGASRSAAAREAPRRRVVGGAVEDHLGIEREQRARCRASGYGAALVITFSPPASRRSSSGKLPGPGRDDRRDVEEEHGAHPRSPGDWPRRRSRAGRRSRRPRPPRRPRGRAACRARRA